MKELPNVLPNNTREGRLRPALRIKKLENVRKISN